MLKVGGRSATVVPQGVLFGSSKAHQAIRELLIEQNQLEAVINLPSGVFKPYAGVSTAILLFTKGGATDHVLFYDVQDDGYSLDDKRDALYQDEQGTPLSFAGDLPKVLADYQRWQAYKNASLQNDGDAGKGDVLFTDREQACFWVSKTELDENKYDLSINRYKETVHVAEQYDAPKDILERWMGLVDEIAHDLKDLEQML